ncbi:MAG: oxidoreductase [Chloroflexota bacterium]|nr:oxidoreductase [Chloroflexota bacterium]
MLVAPLAIAWLTAILLAPLDGRRRWVGWLAVGGLATNFAATVWLTGHVLQRGAIEMVTGGWPPGVGIILRADALGVLFALLSMGVLLAALTYEVIEGVHSRIYPAIVLFMAAGLSGLFITGDAFNFYVFFEVSMTAAFVLATYGEQARETRAALIFTVVNLVGSVLFLSGVVALYHVTGTLDMRHIALWADTVEPSSMILIATIIFVAFSVKLGLFPFHFWLPPVYRDTRTTVAAILSGAVANIGSYGLLRFGADILPRERELGAAVLLLLGVLSTLYGAHQAVSVRTTKEALAYSSISQAGYIMIAFAIGGPVGLTAAILYAVVNALNKMVLFLATGLRGWLVSAAFAIGAFSVAGVPPSIGFFGKAALFQAGIAREGAIVIAILFVGSALAFVYMFQIYQRAFWEGERSGAASPAATRLMVFGLAGLVALLGVWPEPLLALSQQAAQTLTGALP